MNPQSGEDVAAGKRTPRAAQCGAAGGNRGAAYAALYEDPESVAAQLRTVVSVWRNWAASMKACAKWSTALEPASIAVDEAAHALGHYLGKLEADPARLEEIETRLAALEKLRASTGRRSRK